MGREELGVRDAAPGATEDAVVAETGPGASCAACDVSESSWACCWRMRWRRRFCHALRFSTLETFHVPRRCQRETYHLRFLFVLQLLVQLSKAGRARMMWIRGHERAGRRPGRDGRMRRRTTSTDDRRAPGAAVPVPVPVPVVDPIAQAETAQPARAPPLEHLAR